jgi:hypothetical protein
MPSNKCRGSKGECWCSRRLHERFEHYLKQLKEINAADGEQRVLLLRKAPPCLITLLSECGLNVLKGNLKLTDDQYDKLKPHRRMLLRVSRDNATLKERRSALAKKKGGFLPVVLPIILSALSGFAGQAVSKAIGLS